MSNLTMHHLPTAHTGEALSAWHDSLPSNGRPIKMAPNTYAYTTEDPERPGEQAVGVMYHRTTICTVNVIRGTVHLDSGGWRTTTTKHRLNLLGRVLGFRIWQHRGQWYLADRACGERDFYDGIRTMGGRLCPIGCECGAS